MADINAVLKWQPSEDRKNAAALSLFMADLAEKHNQQFKDYKDIWKWSVQNPEAFWSDVWDFTDVIAEAKGDTVITSAAHMKDQRFFPEARLNFAQNLLRRRDEAPAIVFRGEDTVERVLTFKQLYDRVSVTVQALRNMGVREGDRVAGYLPNMPETIIAMLATSAIGAIWSSASPDFGVQGVLDRFGQIEPKVLFATDRYFYNGKEIDCLEKLEALLPQLPSLQKTIIVPYLEEYKDGLPAKTAKMADFTAGYLPIDIEFEQLPFDHPLYIMFSSGTTGIPKCIVHGQGGTLLQHLKEHKLHSDIRRDDTVFYFTTCGWMMWNWLVSALASEACLMLYDGSPFYPNAYSLFDYAAEQNCTLFGTAAKYIDALKKRNLDMGEKYDLSSLRMMASTGSPLVHEGFDYIYDKIKNDLHLASISGGTDIVSCFVLGNPISPVYRGEIQGPGLGMDVDVFDAQGQSLPAGTGELVCKSAFPCMPVGFWGDDDGSRYFEAYFDRFDNVWCHGDWCEWTAHDGLIIHGRSDATLNPGGVRIGTAEIYRQVEKLPEIKESIAVGQDWKNDVRVILFVVMQPKEKLTDKLKKEIKSTIRTGASPRHVPAVIIAVEDIPRTKSGKITELAVRDTIHGKPVNNKEALANPEALALYENLEEL
ncbi:MAG: acetoacetate--CoA ligase [Pseudomonadota bacterium]